MSAEMRARIKPATVVEGNGSVDRVKVDCQESSVARIRQVRRGWSLHSVIIRLGGQKRRILNINYGRVRERLGVVQKVCHGLGVAVEDTSPLEEAVRVGEEDFGIDCEQLVVKS